jgi:hypothetical protein
MQMYLTVSSPRQPQGDDYLSRASTNNVQGYHANSAPPSDDEAETRSMGGKRHRFLSRHLNVPGSKKGGHRAAGTPRLPVGKYNIKVVQLSAVFSSLKLPTFHW